MKRGPNSPGRPRRNEVTRAPFPAGCPRSTAVPYFLAPIPSQAPGLRSARRAGRTPRAAAGWALGCRPPTNPLFPLRKAPLPAVRLRPAAPDPQSHGPRTRVERTPAGVPREAGRPALAPGQ